jgi:hypothetical protein
MTGKRKKEESGRAILLIHLSALQATLQGKEDGLHINVLILPLQ